MLPINWPKFFERIPPGSEPAWLSGDRREARAAAPVGRRPARNCGKNSTDATPAERLPLAVTHLQKQAARVLAMDDGNLPDPRRSLNELGFDSLTGVEFANRVGRSIGQALNPALLFDYPTLEKLRRLRGPRRLSIGVGERRRTTEAETEAEKALDEIQEQALAEVENMSEEEMDALVAEQLTKLQR